MNKIDLNNLDKSTWTTYRFDQIASSISERIDPTNTDLKYYIGLEHIDSENIHITRMGSPGDVSGQKLRCYPGDVIFGRRRAYQRKAAICEVDGFCSAHSLVLRANPEVIDPKLFPFFLHSDTFMHRAVDISVGSLSPTINWGTLKKQEFLLPSKVQQEQLAELFWAMDEVVEKEQGLLKCATTLFHSSEKKLFDNAGFERCGILDVANVKRGKFAHRPRNAPEFYGGDIPFIQTSEVVNAQKFITEYSQTLNELGLSISKMFPIGTIVMTIAANIGYVGILAFDSAFTDSLVGIKTYPDKLDQEYLYYYLNFKQKSIDALATESAQKNLSIDTFKSFKVSFPKELGKQKNIVAELDMKRDRVVQIESKISTSMSLKKSLINQVF